jgi:hypothetical protein
MKLKVSQSDETMIKECSGKMLMANAKLFLITDVKFEDIEETITEGLFKKTTKTIVSRYITSVKIYSYHTEGKFLGTMTDEITGMFLSMYNFYQLRKNWVEFKEMLQAFRIDVSVMESEPTLTKNKF